MNGRRESPDATASEGGPLGRSGSELALVSGILLGLSLRPDRCGLEGRAPTILNP